jgi:polyhydroxybutyrate depolymerase
MTGGLIVASAVVWSIALAGSPAGPLDGGALGAMRLPLQDEDLAPLWSWSAGRVGPGGVEGPGRWAVGLALIGCATSSAVLMARLTAREAGPRAGLCAAGALMLTGAFGPTGGTFALLDAPGWLCWMLTLDRLDAAMAGRRRTWIETGLAWGGALICQPHAALLPIGVALGLGLHRSRARLLVRPAVGLLLATSACLVGFLVVAPGRIPAIGLDGDRLVQVVYLQAIQMFPWLWASLVVALAWGWARWASGRDRDVSAGERVRLGVATVAWIVLTFGSLARPMLPRWGLIGLATMMPALGRGWASALDRRPSYIIRGQLASYAAAATAAVAFGAWQSHWAYESVPGRLESRSLVVAGSRRNYTVYAPRAHDDPLRLPAVLLLHGSGGDGTNFLHTANWVAKAEEGGFLVVAPDALPLLPWRAPHWLFNPGVWNHNPSGSGHPRHQVDDLTFIDALLDEALDRWPIDPGRVFACGYSSGGAMGFRLAAERSERFAAIASVSGACNIPDARPSHPVPTLIIMGSKDVIHPPRGGVAFLPWEIRQTPPVAEILARWSHALGGWTVPCTSDKQAEGTRIITYGPRPSDPRMVFVLLRDHGHAWPGSARLQAERLLSPTVAPREVVDATELTWDFFRDRAHPSAIGLRDDGRVLR